MSSQTAGPRRIWITGGSRGLGRALVRHFASEGARVAFTYGHDEAGAQETLAGADGVLARRVSVSDGVATQAFVRELEQAWGGVDILINNAAISQNLPLALLEEADFDEVMDTNVKGVYLASRAVLRGMIRRRDGVILNVGSEAARTGGTAIHYAASKAAVEGLTRALAQEVARYGIRVNCYAPGLLEGGMDRNYPDHLRAAWVARSPIGRATTLAEAVTDVARLVSAETTFSGEVVSADQHRSSDG